MNDLISRSALLEALENDRMVFRSTITVPEALLAQGEHWRRCLEAAPAVDAVEVVRCGECEKRKTTECALSYFVFDDFDVEVRFLDVPDDFYCPYGERRTK